MAKQAKATATPKLRFPEFQARSDWGSTSLGDASIPITERVGDKELTPISISAGIGFIAQAEKFGRDISGNQYRLYTLVRDGDFVYNKGNSLKFPQGCVYQLRGWGEVAAPNVFITFRLKQGFVAEYFQYCFEKNIHGAQLRKHITSGARSNGLLNLNKEQFFGISIPTPLQDEQQKIADCLRSLDQVIVAQGQKVETLKAQKRGLMQQLFPREGETCPQLRFPEFRNAPGWQDRELGSMTTKVGSGVTPFGGDKNYKLVGRPFIRSQNVGWGRLLLDDIAYIDESTHITFDGTEIAESDVLLNITGASIGRSAIADSRIVGGNVNQHVCIIRTNPDELNPVLLNQFLISERGQKQIENFQAGGNRQGLNFAQIRSFEIPIPPTEEEQQQIADCLSSLDVKITAESDRLATLRFHKLGLMQQLFPVPESDL